MENNIKDVCASVSHFTAEINTTLEVNYTSIKMSHFKKDLLLNLNK